MGGGTNAALITAKRKKDDEFYTRLIDIEKELANYKNEIKGKIIYLNCDNSKYSKFYKFFKDNFKEFGLKRLICTYFAPWTFFENHIPIKATLEIKNGELIETKEEMAGDGDFQSSECIEIMRQSDIIITNPPFSLYRELVKLLTKYDKKYLLISTINSTVYKDVFPLMVNRKMKMGNRINRFIVHERTGTREVELGNTFWFTNLSPINYERPSFVPFESYSPTKFPRYDNYDAINVDKAKSMPKDYYGEMGVPVSIFSLNYHDKFEIVGLITSPVLHNKVIFKRVLVKRKA